MAAPIPLKIPNESFEKYAFHVLINATAEQKKGLTEEERYLLSNEADLKNFCNKKGHVKVEMLLMKIGIEFVRIFYDKYAAEEIDDVIFSTDGQYQYPDKRSDLIGAMVDKKVYVTGSKELMSATLIMAQNSNTKLYQLTQESRDMVRTGKDMRKRAKMYSQPLSQNEILAEAQEAYGQFNKIILQQLNAADYALNNLGMTQAELRIISALYANPYSAISLNELADHTSLSGKAAYLKGHVDKLEEKGLIVSDRTEANKKYAKKIYYLLTSKGVKVMTQYIQYIFQKSYGL